MHCLNIIVLACCLHFYVDEHVALEVRERQALCKSADWRILTNIFNTGRTFKKQLGTKGMFSCYSHFDYYARH